jgi:hypothetical protein
MLGLGSASHVRVILLAACAFDAEQVRTAQPMRMEISLRRIIWWLLENLAILIWYLEQPACLAVSPKRVIFQNFLPLGCLEGPERLAGTRFENTGLAEYRGGNNGTRPLEVRSGFEYTLWRALVPFQTGLVLCANRIIRKYATDRKSVSVCLKRNVSRSDQFLATMREDFLAEFNIR